MEKDDVLKPLERHLSEFSYNSRKPYYNDSSDYTTNAPSYYDDLARKNELIKHLALRIWDYDKEMAERLEEWDKNLESLPDDVIKLLHEWINDGTWDKIINDALNSRLDILSRDNIINVVYPPYGKTGVKENIEMSETLQNLFNDYPGRTFLLPKGTFILENTIDVPEHTTLIGNGGKIKTTSHVPLFNLNSHVTIDGLEIEGTGFYNDNERAFQAIGTYMQWLENITIKNCKVKNIGGYFARFEFVNKGNVILNDMYNLGFSGLIASSCKHIKADHNYIDTIKNGNTNNLAYGIAFNRNGSTDNLDLSPRSSNCTANYNIIKNIEQWEALDTHAGEHITFNYNYLENNFVGIALTQSHSAGVGDYGPQYCTVKGNYTKGTGAGVGIGIAGGQNTDTSKGIVVEGNSIINHGRPDNTISGAMRVRDTLGIIIKDNLVYRPRLMGIVMYDNNFNFLLEGNTVIDSHDPNSKATTGIGVRTGKNSGTIEKNNLLIEDPLYDNNVGNRGIWLTETDEEMVIKNNINEYQVKITGYSNNITALTGFNDIKIITGFTVNPNDQYTAPAGSLFLTNSDISKIDERLFVNIDGTITGWRPLSLHSAGFTEGKPSNPSLGTMYWNRTHRFPTWWNGANWTTADGTVIEED